jgi:hypothetical protein
MPIRLKARRRPLKKVSHNNCGRPATTTEHVPPPCIFPERKDAFGVDHRKNLITVPSCDEHNLKKSKDDEFLMACITPNVGNNLAAYVQTGTKLYRAVKRSGGRMLKSVLTDAKPFDLVMPDGTKFPLLVGRPDIPRLCRILEHVARGLYFSVIGRRFVGRCIIFPAFVRFPNGSYQAGIKQLLYLLVSQERGKWAILGENPDIFYFQLGSTDQYGLIPMVMTFFRGTHVMVAFHPEGVELPFRRLR